MGATLPVRPVKVCSRGISWTRHARWWWAGEWAGTFYQVTYGMRVRDSWDVQFSNGGPFRELTGETARVVVDSLVGWLAAQGHEVPR